MEFKANAVNLKKEKKNQKSAEALGKDEGKETGKDNEN